MNNSSIYKWIIALLVVLNLTTAGTILVNRYQSRQQNETILTDSNVRVNGRYMRQELGFDNEQMAVFRKANRAFQPEARKLLTQIDSLKQVSFVELNKLNPDTLVLNTLATQIGDNHGKLKQATHRFYIQIRSVCTPEQAKQFQTIFTPLFRDEAPCNRETNRNFQHKNKSLKK